MVTYAPVVLRRHQGRLRTSPLDHTGFPSNLVLERWQAVLRLYIYAGYVRMVIFTSPRRVLWWGRLRASPRTSTLERHPPQSKRFTWGRLQRGGLYNLVGPKIPPGQQARVSALFHAAWDKSRTPYKGTLQSRYVRFIMMNQSNTASAKSDGQTKISF